MRTENKKTITPKALTFAQLPSNDEKAIDRKSDDVDTGPLSYLSSALLSKKEEKLTPKKQQTKTTSTEAKKPKR